MNVCSTVLGVKVFVKIINLPKYDKENTQKKKDSKPYIETNYHFRN